jgi:hypothetical protein
MELQPLLTKLFSGSCRNTFKPQAVGELLQELRKTSGESSLILTYRKIRFTLQIFNEDFLMANRIMPDWIIRKSFIRSLAVTVRFIGLNQAIVPRAFSSVTGPVYLMRGYSKMMLAIEEAELLSTLKRANNNYMFFVESDFKSSVDSSLIYSTINNSFSVILKGGEGKLAEFKLSRTSLRNLVLSHVAEYQPKELPARNSYPIWQVIILFLIMKQVK